MDKIKIKICGITKEEEAQWLNEVKVDFAGMVLFFPKSRRNISIEQAVKIMKVLDKNIKPVAVTVEPSMEEIRQIEEAGFAYLQIHGNTDPDLIETCQIPVLKAFNGKDMENFSKYQNLGQIAGYVLDAQTPGSGKTFDWPALKELPDDGKLMLLAGGLTPENVCDAVRQTGVKGVDVSSGVENDNGIGKNYEKIIKFVRNVRYYF